MPYNKTMTWAELEQMAESASTSLKNALENGKNAYDKFISLKGAMTSAELAATFSLSDTPFKTIEALTAAIDEVAATLQAQLELYNSATNQVVAQGDRMFSLRKFA